MTARNPRELMNWVKDLSSRKDIDANVILQNFMLERLLERISVSKYKNKFILKGGMLITAIVGIDMRNTLDMDATIKGFDLEKENVEKILNEIIDVDINDEIKFELADIKDIREEDQYGGYRALLNATFGTLKFPMKIDITTGDVIIPKEVKYRFGLMFEKRSIEILAYNLETVLADKFETIISRNINNTRARDFYDIYILWNTQTHNFDKEILKQAIIEKFKYRDTFDKISNLDIFILKIRDSKALKEYWKKYCNSFSYAEEITYEDVFLVVEKIARLIK